MTEITNETTDKSKEISYTSEELNEWVKAKLIPIELLQNSKAIDLINYIRENKQILHSHYHRNQDDDKYYIELPPPSQWKNAPDLQVIDKKTGNVVSILEMASQYEIIEGVSLKIRAKELKDWEIETGNARTLTKEQKKDLKGFIETCGNGRPLTRKEIVAAIDAIRKPHKKEKVRHSGHYVDSKLKYTDPKESQITFDTISTEMKMEIENSNVELKKTVLGISLTPAEDKLMNAILKLLHDNSETHDQQSENFYGGNYPGDLTPYGKEIEKSRYLRIKPSDLYKEYLGDDRFSGKEITNIKNVLNALHHKKFLIIYNRKRQVKVGSKTENRTDRIEEFQNLIQIVRYIEDMTDSEVHSLDHGDSSVMDRKGELIIALNPLLTDQINLKYVEYPTDINKRTMLASGGHLHVTESILALRDYMLREISAKRYKCEINVDKLPFILKLNNYVKSHRKKLIQQRIDDAFNAVKNLGIITNIEIIEGALGQKKYVFTLNKDFE